MNLDNLRGQWALVTGASSGIGREYCMQLAAKGMNIVLVARREERLVSLASGLEREYAVRTLVIVQDLAAAGAASAVREKAAAAEVVIRLLVNNAAFGRWGRFEETAQETYHEMLQTNVVALVEMTHAFLPQLAAAAPCAIINLASGAAYQPVPFMAVYAATKAFVLNFSQALYGEWNDRGVLVQTLVPGPTESEFDQVAGAYASAIMSRGSPAKVVEDSLSALQTGEPVAINAKGIFKQRLFAGLASPRFIISQVAKMFRPPHVRT